MTENRYQRPADHLALCIFRTKKKKSYARISNSVFDDRRLSWEARGLLGYLLAKPDDWKVRLYDLVRRGPAREHKVRRMLRELEAVGYMHRRRRRNADGTFDWVVIILEAPALARSARVKSLLGT